MLSIAPIIKTRPLRAKPERLPFPISQLMLLEKFKPQENIGKERKPAKVAQNPRIALLEDGFLRFHANAIQKFGKELRNDSGNTREIWDDFQEFAIHTNVTPSELEEFTLKMGKFERREQFPLIMGIYLSMLLHDSSHNHFRLQLMGSDKRLERLCWNCNKNVVILGDVGSDFCVAMHAARVVLHGNTEGFAGYMLCAGTLCIIGNVDGGLGQAMSGGRVIVRGHVSYSPGEQMSGGEITINGSCNGAGDLMFGGKITINGDAGVEAGANMRGGMLIVNGTWGKGVCEGMDKGTVHLNGKGRKPVWWVGQANIYLNGKQIVKGGKELDLPKSK